MCKNDNDNTEDKQNIINHMCGGPYDSIAMITLTLKPKLYKYQSLTQYELTVHDIKVLMYSLTNRYVLSTELTSNGNIHYHVIAGFRDKYQRVMLINKMRRNRKLGFHKFSNDIVKAEDLASTVDYIIKDIKTTKRILHNTNYKPDIIIYG